jgi:hypothetical protein
LNGKPGHVWETANDRYEPAFAAFSSAPRLARTAVTGNPFFTPSSAITDVAMDRRCHDRLFGRNDLH